MTAAPLRLGITTDMSRSFGTSTTGDLPSPRGRHVEDAVPRPQPEERLCALQGDLQVVSVSQPRELPHQKRRPGVEGSVRSLPELPDLLPGHSVGHEGGPLVGEVREISGNGPVLAGAIVQIGSGEGGDGVKAGHVGVDLAGEFDGPGRLLAGLPRYA